MIKKLRFLFSFTLMMCMFSMLKAQTQYGDGSMVLRSELSQDWFNNNSKFEPRDSSDYEFNGMDLMTKYFQKNYDAATSTWTPYYITINGYDSKGNNTLYIDSFLNVNDMDGNFKGVYTYNNNGYELTHLYYNWNTSKSNWELDERGTTTYTSFGLENVDLRETYDNTNGVWVNSVRRTQTYDGSNKVIYYIKEVWDKNTNKWVNDYKVLYFRGGSNLDSMIYQRYNIATSTWVNDDKFVYGYNGSNKVTDNAQFDWVNNKWQPVSKSTSTFLSDGQLLTYMYELWDNTTKALVPSYKTLYAFNSKNWEIRDSLYYWNKTTSAWDLNFHDINVYNANGYQISLTKERYNSVTTGWDNYSRIFYRYTAKPANAIKKETIKQFALFPNPANNLVNLVSTEIVNGKCSIQICDSKGKTVCRVLDSEPMPGTGIAINLGDYNLSSGLYYLMVKTEAGTTSLPLMVK